MGRHKTYERGEVLRKAMRLFWEKGYEGTHLKELIEVTGINRFSLYQEFGGKQGLFDEALESYIGDLSAVVGQLEREPPGLANVEAFWRAVVEFPFVHGCFAMNTISEKHVVARRSFKRIADLVRRVESGLATNLEAAQRRGELPPGPDAEDLARFLTALDIGTLAYASLGREAPEKRAQIFAVARAVLGAPPPGAP